MWKVRDEILGDVLGIFRKFVEIFITMKNIVILLFYNIILISYLYCEIIINLFRFNVL